MGSHFDDGFGEAQDLTEELDLADYHKWLHYVAYQMLPATSALHEDLVQEGRIAMWKALATYDPSKGALPSWVTKAASMRMKDFVRRGTPTGKPETRGSKEVEHGPSIDAMVEEGGAEGLFAAVDTLEGVEVSYHHGEILEALNSLSPKQREYVYLRFWGGLDPSAGVTKEMKVVMDQFPVLRQRWLWQGSSKQVGAKDRLREALSHLQSV